MRCPIPALCATHKAFLLNLLSNLNALAHVESVTQLIWVWLTKKSFPTDLYVRPFKTSFAIVAFLSSRVPFRFGILSKAQQTWVLCLRKYSIVMWFPFFLPANNPQFCSIRQGAAT